MGIAPGTPLGATPDTPVGIAPGTPLGIAPGTPLGIAPGTPLGVVPGKPVGVAPGTPEDRLQFLRDAFDKIVTTEGFLEQAGLRWLIWTEPLSGKEAAGQVEAAMGIPPEYRLRLAELVNKYTNL